MLILFCTVQLELLHFDINHVTFNFTLLSIFVQHLHTCSKICSRCYSNGTTELCFAYYCLNWILVLFMLNYDITLLFLIYPTTSYLLSNSLNLSFTQDSKTVGHQTINIESVTQIALFVFIILLELSILVLFM